MKSPAVLLYTSDFLTGVSNLTMEERGQYITLLCLQHQQGHLSKKIMNLAVGIINEDVLKKFEVDENGLFFQHRMEEEIAKREHYVGTRYENGYKGGRPPKNKEEKNNHMDNHMDRHMGNHIEDVNDNINSILESNNISNNIRLLFIEYITLRKKSKLSNSNTVIVRLVNKLIEYGKTEDEQKEIIEKAILGNWKDFYEIENKKKKEVVKYETVR